MDDQVRKTFDELARGGDPGDLTGLQRKLLYACFDAAGDTDPDRRLDALRVAGHLDVDDRVRVVDPLIRDADDRVRRYAFNLACAAKEHGIEPLRGAVNGTDIDLAVDAMGLLVTQGDKATTMHARSWLRHDDPRIRAGAAMLLGNVAGPAMAVHLGRLAESDPVKGVRVVAAEAVKRCTGELPKNAPKPFWEAGPVDLAALVAVPDDPEPEAAPQPEPTPPPTMPSRGAGNLATIYPEDVGEGSDGAPTETGLVPSADDDTPEDVREALARDWRDPAPLPSTMPTEATAILKLLGMVRVEDRPSVLSAFEALDGATRSGALSWTPGSDESTGRGIALAVKGLGSKTHASMLRVMLREPGAGVRAAAAEAIGTTGALSMIPQLADLLSDDDPDVRIAAIRGLAELLVRKDRIAMLRDRLAPCANDSDERVKKAAADALAAAKSG
jgi:HEAT repeat protein